MAGWKTIVSFWDGFLAGAMLVSGRVSAQFSVLNHQFLNGSSFGWKNGYVSLSHVLIIMHQPVMEQPLSL